MQYLCNTGVVKNDFSCIADKITVTYGKEIDTETKEEFFSSLGFCGNYLSDQSQGPTDLQRLTRYTIGINVPYGDS